MLMALTKFLTFFERGKTIIFSHLISTNFNDNFKDKFMREKINEITSKAKTVNICALEHN